jgi:cyanophycin synthetase
MKQITFEDIRAMKGNGSSMRTVLKCFIDKGADIYLLHENVGEYTERFFLIKYEDLTIPLRAYNLNFYSIFNSHLARSITSNKLNSEAMLKAFNIYTPATILFSDNPAAENFLVQYETCVVKPASGAHGDGITTNITKIDDLHSAVEHARQFDSQILIQQQVSGYDHRLLFMNYEFLAAVQRLPATITGNGLHSIRKIVDDYNTHISELWEDIRRGKTSADLTRGSISKIPLSEIVAARGEDFLNYVPAAEETVQVLDKANVSLGGKTKDITDMVNADLANSISNVLKALNLPLCGVDVLTTDISSSPADQKSYIIELNAAPGLRLHELPAEGRPRQVCAALADSLIRYYKQNSS